MRKTYFKMPIANYGIKKDELGDIQNPEAFSITLVKKSLSDFLRLAQSKPKRQRRGIETVLLTTDSSPEKELEEKRISGVYKN